MAPKHSAGPRRAIPPALDDHVRIVPLWIPRDVVRPAPGIRAPAGPELTYRGGPLIAAVEMFTAFWGQAWKTTDQQGVITTLNEFFRFIVASPCLRLTRYFERRTNTSTRARIARPRCDTRCFAGSGASANVIPKSVDKNSGS